MSARKQQGIAEDASDYADLPELNEGEKKKKGIAEDAALFEDMLEESSEAARSLQSDWLYQLDGHVFGPVKPKELLEMLYKGEITADTMVAVEEEDFRPLRRYGVFRAHLPKVKSRLAEVETEKALERAENKKRVLRRIAWIVTALALLAGGSYALVQYIRKSREERALAEKKKLEDALKAELAALEERIDIQPALLPLVEEEEADKKAGRKAKRRRRGGRGVARFTGTGELQREEIMDGVASVFGGLKRCIIEQMHRDEESVPEQIIMTFAVNNQGKAQEVSLTDRILRNSPMRSCMAGQLAKAKWRAFKGEVQNIEYPITIGRR
jgi:hypothetical protein